MVTRNKSRELEMIADSFFPLPHRSRKTAYGAGRDA